MSRARTIAAAGAAVLISTLLVGCGSDDDKTLTAKEFRSQANALCKDANEDADKIGTDLDENSSDADVSKAVDQVVARNEELVDDLEELEAPKSLQADVDDLLDSVREALDKLDEVGSVQDLTSMEDPFKEVNEKSSDLGLDVCAQD